MKTLASKVPTAFFSKGIIIAFLLVTSMFSIDGYADDDKLTREHAAKLLNKYLSSKCAIFLEFNDDGIARAKQAGMIKLISSNSFMSAGTEWIFTQKGLQMVGKIIKDNRIFIPVIPPNGAAGGHHLFSVKDNSICMKVAEVTGIAEGVTPSIKEVEYTTARIFPAEMETVKNYFFTNYSGMKTKFKKYDDGWRVSP